MGLKQRKSWFVLLCEMEGKILNAAGLVEKLKDISGMTSITLNVNTKRNNVILGNEILPLWGKDYITDYIEEVNIRFPLHFIR